MCGIVGISSTQPWPGARELVAAMAVAVAHRGPDSDGLFSCDSGTTHLGFRRLAIRDLDRRADQPMHSASGRTTLVFNGEIYNTGELAAKCCPTMTPRTTGDSEVFLEAFEARGDEVFSDCNGMFAAAFYDHRSQTLVLARDRMGKKPLYLYEGDGFVAFASELRALDGFGLEPDPGRAPYFFHFGYMPSPYTFFRRTSQLRPGELVVVRRGRIVRRRRFYDPSGLDWGCDGHVDPDAMNDLLADAVAIRTSSDVPLGVFLSGGVDSTLVAAQIRKNAGKPLPTYTVAFDESRFNEAPFAAAVARDLGLPHTEIRISKTCLDDLVTDYVDCYEQPYADTSGLPSMLLCREVKKHVTVALSGDGGDEFFGGYARYDWYRQALAAQRLPRLVRTVLGHSALVIDRRRGHRISRLLETQDAAGLYAAIIRGWTVTPLAQLLPDVPAAGEAPVQLVRDLFGRLDADPLSKAACFDAAYYIPDDLQVKMDRASMRVALEVRCPLLDHRFARLGARLATAVKFKDGKKSVLKKLLARHVTPERFSRPKQGFSVPLAKWLAGPLAGRLHDALDQKAFRQCGWLDAGTIDSVRRKFQQGQLELAHSLWMLFVMSLVLAKAPAPTAAFTGPMLTARTAA